MIKAVIIAGAVLVAQAQSPAPSPSPAAPAAAIIPAGTKIPLHLAQTISSHDAHTGETFTFYVDQDVLVNGAVVVSRCAAGNGTVTLAGKHGINGHEGNLRLRFDTVTDEDGTAVPLAADEQSFNGRNRKALSFFTTRWIVGDDVDVKPDKELIATVAKDTPVGPAHDPVPACAQPSSSPAANQ